MTKAIAIGVLAELTGVKITTIRYYESIGLLLAPLRTGGNRRIYGQRDVERLTFIRRSRKFGLPLETIRDLLDLDIDRAQPCQAATRIAEMHLVEIERRIAELEALKNHFRMIIDLCNGEHLESCPIMMTLRGTA